MKKGILITALILMVSISLNAQDKWVEKSENGESVEKEMIFFKQGMGPGFGNDCYGYGQRQGHRQWGGKGMCDSRGSKGRHGKFGSGHSGGQGMFSILRHAEMLDLTDSQIDKMKEMKYNFKLTQVDQKAAIEKAQLKLGKMKRDEVSEKKVFAGIDNVSNLKAEMKKKMYKHHADMKNLLTDEQKEKIKELRKGSSVKKFRKGGMKKFGNGHPF